MWNNDTNIAADGVCFAALLFTFHTTSVSNRTEGDFDFKSWCRIFQGAKVNSSCLEANLNRSRQHRFTITELLMKNSVALQSSKLKRDELFLTRFYFRAQSAKEIRDFLWKSTSFFVSFVMSNLLGGGLKLRLNVQHQSSCFLLVFRFRQSPTNNLLNLVLE